MFDKEGIYDIEDGDILSRKVSELRKKQFIEGCNEAYDILKEVGDQVITEENKLEVKEAINRAIGYFVQEEEYEKCQELKLIFQNVYGEDPSPVQPNFPSHGI